MACFTDPNAFVCVAFAILGFLAFLSPCFSTELSWLKMVCSMVLAVVLYTILVSYLPGVFGINFGVAFLWTALLTGVFYALTECTKGGLLALAAILIVGSVAIHNVALIPGWMQDRLASGQLPPWIGVVVIVAIILFIVVLFLLAQLYKVVVAIVFVLASSVILYVDIRLIMIERDGTREVCCTWQAPPSYTEYDPTLGLNITVQPPIDQARCPLALENVGYMMILVSLLVVSTILTWTYHFRCGGAYKRLVSV